MLALVVRSTLAMVGVGLIAGLAGAAALSRVTRSLLFEVSALEPAAFAFGGLAMATFALAAAALPARRATRVDPATALRREG